MLQGARGSLSRMTLLRMSLLPMTLLQAWFLLTPLRQTSIWRRGAVRLCAFLMMLTAVPASAQLSAELDLETASGYGRVVITFPDREILPGFDLRTNNGVLVIDWVDEVSIDLGRAAQTLDGYITILRKDTDNGALRFALARGVRVNTMEAGERLFVDFLPPNWSGPAPGLPEAVVAELAERARDALERARRAERRLENLEPVQLDLKIGLNPTFTRFSFEWNAPFESSFVRKGEEVLVNFDQPAELDVSAIKVNPPPGVFDVLTSTTEDELRLLMVVDERADVRAFKVDNRYVLDVSNPDGPRDPSQAMAPEVFNREVSAVGSSIDAPLPATGDIMDVVTTRGVTSAQAPPPLPTAAALAQSLAPQAQVTTLVDPEAPQQRAAAGDALSQPTMSAQPIARPTRAAAAGSQAPATAPATLPATGPATGPADPSLPASTQSISPPPDAPRDARPDALQDAPGDVAVSQSAMPVSTTAEPQQSAEGQGSRMMVPLVGPRAFAEAVPDDALLSDDIIRVNANRIGNVVRMEFPFKRETPGAVFQRGNSLWLVFETASELELSAARVALTDFARSMEMQVIDGAKVLRLDLYERYLTGFGIDATAIVLTIGDRVLDPSQPLEMKRSYRGDGALTLRVPFARASRIFDIPDPLVGDMINVVTGYGPARGLLKERRFAELEGLVSAHGVAIVPSVDDVELLLTGDELVISRPQGLRLSFSDVKGGTSLNNGLDNGLTGEFIEFSELHIDNPNQFTDRVRTLEAAIAEAEPDEMTARRLDLIRFFLANRFAHEALAQLRVAGADDPKFARTPGYHVLSGAAQILAYRADQAAPHLTRPEWSGRADAAMWQTIAFTHTHEWAKASEAAEIGESVIGYFPDDLQATFFLAAARSALELNDLGSATHALTQIEPDKIDPALAAEYDYLRGRVADRSGRPDVAHTLWEVAGRSRNLAVGAEAMLEMLKLEHRQDRVPAQEIIEKTESLTFSWRGDETEIKSLRFLSELYTEEGRYRDAFQVLEGAVLASPESPTTRLMQEEMAAVFLALILDDAADDLDPVKALALFYDYRSMVPIGRKGDEVVRELASRLVDLDLLDQAAELLRHQVDNRLEGAASAQVATELALIHILNRQPERALNVLARTRVSGLPLAVERQRRILEARALGDIGRNEQALTLLDGMKGPDAQRMRAENYWAMRLWQEAGLEYESIPGSRWKEDLELTDTERQDVLRAGIAFALAGDALATERIRGKYAPLMANGPEAVWFDTIAADTSVSSPEFRDVATRVASKDSYATFLEEYRRQYDPSLAAPPQQTPPPFGERQPDPVGFQEAQTDAAEGDDIGQDGGELMPAGDDADPDGASNRGASAPQPAA